MYVVQGVCAMYMDIYERLDRQKMGEKRAEIENAFGGSHVTVEFVTARWLTLLASLHSDLQFTFGIQQRKQH